MYTGGDKSVLLYTGGGKSVLLYTRVTLGAAEGERMDLHF